MLDISETKSDITFAIFVQPRASKNEIKGLHGNALKVRLTAPPVDGAANKMCVKFLAKCFSVSKANISIISGHSSRTKRICIQPDPGQDAAGELLRIKHQINLFAEC